jgi:hypothetical protein
MADALGLRERAARSGFLQRGADGVAVADDTALARGGIEDEDGADGRILGRPVQSGAWPS